MVNVLANPDFGRATTFDYVAYLNSYYPGHFLASSLSIVHIVGAGLMVSIATVSFHLLGPDARPFQLVLAGYIIVYLVGIFLPYVSHNAALLNLHLLRVSTFFHILAALGCLGITTKWLKSDQPLFSRFLAPSLIVLTCTVRHAGLVAPLLMLAVYLPKRLVLTLNWIVVRLRWPRELILTVGVAALVWVASTTWSENRKLKMWTAEWTELGQWARINSPENAIFSVPTVDFIKAANDTTMEKEVAEIGPATFEVTSHRRVWIDFRRGAAVMWSSSYYETWWARANSQFKLKTLNERLDFAVRNGVTYVIDLCNETDQSRALKRTTHLCVFEPSRT